MNKNRFIRLIVVVGSLGGSATASAEDVVWINELESNSKLVGKEIVVEGRFQQRGVGTDLNQIRLKNSKVSFHLAPEADRRFPSGMRFIRVVGTMTKSGDTLSMRVKSWSRINATDEDRYQDIAGGIGPTDSRVWYDLAERTTKLAEFYDEADLRTLARDARVSGFRAEESSVRTTQPDALLALADRAVDLGLDAEESGRMRHKALRWEFDRLHGGNPTASDWSKLADRIAELLPGAKTPLKPADSDAVAKYRANPLESYEQTPRIRPMADREFWIDATTRALRVASELSNANLSQLAADAKRLLPDRQEVGRELLRKWAESEAARISTLPPASQVFRLADVFKTELGDEQRAQDVIRQWLEARRKRLSAKDADGRVRLAKEYRARLRDDETARTLLLEAVRIEADLPEAAEALKSLGYIKGPNGWVPSRDASATGKQVVANRPSDRLLRIDMAPAQVKEILGEPKAEDKIRFTDRAKDGRRIVIEQWLYRLPPDLYVSFKVASPSDVRVIAINTQSQK
jgi:hypothetical protein